MQTKDYFTIGISALAFVLSVISLALSSFWKLSEEQRTLRLSLNDIIGKILEARIEHAKFIFNNRDNPEILETTRTGRTFNEQMSSLARVASYIVTRIPHLATTIDYGIIGDAFALAGNYDGARQYFERIFNNSKDRNSEPLYHRTFAGYLYQWGDPEGGRKEYEEALKSAYGDDDSSKYQRGYTYRTWALSEKTIGNIKSEELFNKAEQTYNTISDSGRKRIALCELNRHRKA